MLESFKTKTNQPTTMENYIGIWRTFNKFILRLDILPSSWEERRSLFGTYMVNMGHKSATLKSYMSAIKKILQLIDYEVDDKKLQLNTLTRACKLINDCVRQRLPIGAGLLEVILQEIQRKYTAQGQIYLEILYKTIFLFGYYGLMRIGELVQGVHTLCAKDVHLALNKKCLQLVLYSSKTHTKASLPQRIKISATQQTLRRGRLSTSEFCPFEIANQYLQLRNEYYEEDNEHFFINSDGSQISQNQVRTVLKDALQSIGLQHELYDTHSLRIGRATDLLQSGCSIDEIKQVGRWKSNAVFRYLRV